MGVGGRVVVVLALKQDQVKLWLQLQVLQLTERGKVRREEEREDGKKEGWMDRQMEVRKE